MSEEKELEKAENPHSEPDRENDNTDDTIVVSNSETAAQHPEVKTTQDVRQGHTGDHVRYILLFSFLGALAGLMALALIFIL